MFYLVKFIEKKIVLVLKKFFNKIILIQLMMFTIKDYHKRQTWQSFDRKKEQKQNL